MSEADLNKLKVIQLKQQLRKLNLRTDGLKVELIARIMEATKNLGTPVNGTSGTPVESAMTERESQLLMELAEMRRQLQRQTLSAPCPVFSSPTPAVGQSFVGNISITTIAELLPFFDGDGEKFERWEKQVRLLAMTYSLSEEMIKVLIGSRLRGKALEWFHSRPEFLEIGARELMDRMREMFYRRLNKTTRRRRFEERVWQPREPFNEYLHHKVILGNNVPIDEDEIVDLIIEGIPDGTLRNQAYIQRFSSPAALMEAFEKVELRGMSYSNRGAVNRSAVKDPVKEENSRRYQPQGHLQPVRRCPSCGLMGHQLLDCPTREKGVKCFACQGYGHISVYCPTKLTPTRSSYNVDQPMKYEKETTIFGHEVTAVIDTGSDICLMRASLHAELGAPRLQRTSLRFRGIGSDNNETWGVFNTDIFIDSEMYPIAVHVIADRLMQPALIIGADFLRTVNVSIRNNHISISKIDKDVSIVESVPEVYSIVAYDSSEVDTSYIVNREDRYEIERIINNYKPCRNPEPRSSMKIILRDEEPIHQRARRLSPVDREEVNRQVSLWLDEDIIRPSLSDFASPIVLVKKKDGSKRLCVDYRQLNKKTIRDRYPLPLIEDQLDMLQGSKLFSTLDLKNGFFHVKVEELSRKYTAFITPDGQYEFCRVPFGLANSPAVFQKFINNVFRQLISQNIVLAYMDDLIVPSIDSESGLDRLRTVLDTAANAGLIINWKKCRFLQSRVEFLGHIIESGTVRPSEEKTAAVMRFSEPKSVKQLQSFLGLSGYFRKFIPHYSIIVRPLTNLLKADAKFHFGDQELIAFNQLKSILSNKPVLKLYKTNVDTELHTDASMFGFGAVLMQRDSSDGKLHPVYYASGKTTEAESKYSSYELEILAVVRALKKFRVYLLGIPFKIVTDCRAFTLTMNKKDLCVRVARWALLLEEFNYTIEHRSGSSMRHVDALSRIPVSSCLFTVSEDTLTAKFRKAQREDSDIKRILELEEWGKANGYSVNSGLLFKETDNELLLVVPKTMQMQIIRQVHERGHFSVAKTLALLQRDYYIPNAAPKIKRVINNCVACILAERKHGKQEGLLNSVDKGEMPLDTYHIDYLGPLPSTRKNYKHILVVIDGFSKFTWLYATKAASASEVIIRLTKQSAIFGNPRRIVSDRGSAFTSAEFRNYCTDEGIEHQLITTGIPRANGQVERVNRILIPVLAKMSHPKHEEWFRYLDSAQKCLNTTLCRSVGASPFRILFGTHPRLRENHEVRQLLEKEWVAEFQNMRDEIRDQAKENIQKIQAENRRTYNKNRKRATIYSVNDMVAIRRTQQGPGLKLASKFLGPYKIIKKLRNDRYVVERIGDHEGPLTTSTAADHLKLWACDDEDLSELDADECDNNSGSDT